MRWPLVTRKRHEAVLAAEVAAATQSATQAEYKKRLASARAWAVELNYNLFQLDDFRIKGAVRAALQNFDQIVNFTPPKSDSEPIKRLPRPIAGARWPEDISR